MEETTPTHGTLTVWGYGAKVRVFNGHLIAEWGVCDERYSTRLPRVNSGLERLILLDPDGYLSFSALDWLRGQRVHVLFLDRDGDVLGAVGPPRPRDAKLLRAQVMAGENGVGLTISRHLIACKLAGQERVARALPGGAGSADAIARARSDLSAARTMDTVRLLESQAAMVYWDALAALPISFPKPDLPRVPAHWRTFGRRHSPLTGRPQRAANPAHALLNYAYTMLLSECSIALSAVALDPSLGYLHADAANRDSLACDVMEAARPSVDTWLVDWLQHKALKREFFGELPDGQCRLMPEVCSLLSETAPMWRKEVAPWAEWVAHMLWANTPEPERGKRPASRLTGRAKREAQGKRPLPPLSSTLKPPAFCRTCGVPVASRLSYCGPCAAVFQREQIMAAQKAGWAATHTPKAERLRGETQSRHEAGKRAFRAEDLPRWLTPEAYLTRVQPRLAHITVTSIATALGISWAYAARIHRGVARPHPRHWVKLAKLAGAIS